jgi:hypothetical protein
MVERIELKIRPTTDQMYECQNGHQLLIRSLKNILGITLDVTIMAEPWDMTGRLAVGLTHVATSFVPQAGEKLEFKCPKCPAEIPYSVVFVKDETKFGVTCKPDWVK